MSLSGHILGCCSILSRTNASLGCGLPLSVKGQQRLRQQYLPPCPIHFVLILSSACCRRLTRPCNVPGDFLHTCRADACFGEPVKAGGEQALAQCHLLGSQLIAHPQLGPDRLFLSLFCINLRHCSTSSDVTNTHGFSLLSPLRKVGGDLVWAVQYFCFGLVILETNLKTYVHFSSFM